MKKTIRVIIIVLCILICLCGGGYLVYEHFNREENKDVYEKLQEQVHEEIAAPEPEEDRECFYYSFICALVFIGSASDIMVTWNYESFDACVL